MRFHGQRWRHRVGNSVVNVDNAFSWMGWAQERMMVNDEVVQQAGQWFAMRRSFDEPWLTLIGDDVLKVKLRSTLSGLTCGAEVSGEAIKPEALFQVSWTGVRGDWLPEQNWLETKAFLF